MVDGPHVDYEVEPDTHLADLLTLDRWFNWKLTDDRKIPRAPWFHDDPDTFTSWKNQEMWTDFETAADWSAKLSGFGIASCIPAYEDNTLERLILFDFDNCRDPGSGAIHPEAWAFIEQYELPAYLSTSGTGLHGFGYASIPDGIKPSFERDLNGWEHDEQFDEPPSMEVYGSARFVALTGDHIAGTPNSAADLGEMGHDLFSRYGNAITNTVEHEPSVDQAALDDMESTTSHDVLFDAISATDPRDIRVRSTVTEERADGVKSLDPSWETSESGTRLAMFDDHFLYRKGNHRLDCLQLVALEERIINDPTEYPTGSDFFDAVDDLRDRGARIPRFVGTVSAGDRVDPEAVAEAEDSAAEDTETDEDGDKEATNNVSWRQVRDRYQMSRSNDNDVRVDDARHLTFRSVLERYSYATDEETDVLYVYDPDTGYYKDRGEVQIKQKLVRNLEQHHTTRVETEVISKIRGETYTSQDEFDGEKWLLNVENGVLDVRDRTLRSHDPKYLYRSKSPARYDPDAEAPTFEKFIQQVTPSEQDAKKLQEYAGYTLLHSQLPYHKALFIVGPQASGKSTFLDLMRSLLGDEAVSSVMPQQMITERFAAVDLYGAMANIRNDINETMIKRSGTFKEIIAGEPIKVEEKHQPTFTIEPTAKHMYAANQLPDAAVDDDAFYRRILLVAFPTTIPRSERDPWLKDKLADELDGVLNWALDGLDRLREQDGFTGDRSAQATRETWESWGSSLGKFKDAAISHEPGERVPKGKLYNAYLRFCRDRGIPAISGQQKFTHEFTSSPEVGQGSTTIDGKTTRTYTSVAVNWNRIPGGENPDDDDDDTMGTGLKDF